MIINLNNITSAIVIAVSAFSIIYTAGVVWRVEKKLDISYKFFLAAIIAFTLWQSIEFAGFSGRLWNIIIFALKFFFALLFLKGILTMRRMVRVMDGELPDVKNEK